ncbi:hypothetical protein NPX13_g6232 [Xylaria arbuscula]|uniref:Uncharacterized protein n=1 Tax=Xylaria arbuscula TaxID=114810 RepID=A0A9W8NCY0_9PEZI|nr:hypothetical protein NPX13_g6232 [Xylaria arbuscula]
MRRHRASQALLKSTDKKVPVYSAEAMAEKETAVCQGHRAGVHRAVPHVCKPISSALVPISLIDALAVHGRLDFKSLGLVMDGSLRYDAMQCDVRAKT